MKLLNLKQKFGDQTRELDTQKTIYPENMHQTIENKSKNDIYYIQDIIGDMIQNR